jgi:TM2 domain-containing membrane protein YozV
MLGIHRFFNGKVGTGILMIITFGWFGIWWLIDGIIIVMWKFTDAENKFVKIQIEKKS